MFLLSADAWEVRGRAFSSDDYGKGNRGVFATQPIRPGTILGDYLGLAIPTDREDEYESGRDVYLMAYDDRVSIWPDPATVGIHLINHSCEPNAGITTLRGHTLYFALRAIHSGEELTVSYLLGPLDADCAPCRHGCWCRARSCTGSMHLPIDRYAAWRQFDAREAARAPAEPVEAGQVLPPLDRYPARISDRGFHPIWGSTAVPPKVLLGDRWPDVAVLRRELRRSGRRLAYPRLGLTVLGSDGAVVTVESTESRASLTLE